MGEIIKSGYQESSADSQSRRKTKGGPKIR
jgi:hypothetical protein